MRNLRIFLEFPRIRHAADLGAHFQSRLCHRSRFKFRSRPIQFRLDQRRRGAPQRGLNALRLKPGLKFLPVHRLGVVPLRADLPYLCRCGVVREVVQVGLADDSRLFHKLVNIQAAADRIRLVIDNFMATAGGDVHRRIVLHTRSLGTSAVRRAPESLLDGLGATGGALKIREIKVEVVFFEDSALTA